MVLVLIVLNHKLKPHDEAGTKTKLEHVYGISGLAYFQLGNNLRNKFLDYKINMKLFRGNQKMADFIMRKKFVI